MSQHSKARTLRFYDEHGDEYVRGTIGVSMEPLYGSFLEILPAGGKILDAGCGSGRDTKAFLQHGYEVTAIDGSEKMVEATTALSGIPARQMLLQQIDFQNDFDGVWACASMLHVPRQEIDSVLEKIIRSLRPAGICYMSFKEGDCERWEGDRLFTDFTAQSLEACLAGCTELTIIRIWITDDLRPGRDERWVNALVRKGSD